MTERALISLGGNLGNPAETFDLALRSLNQHSAVTIQRVSSFHTTTPVGDATDHAFLNATALCETTLSPLQFLDLLLDTEHNFGRVRDQHWGARTLDLDLLFYGDEVINSPRLILPHPCCWYRRFVLDPLVEIAPDFVHPVKQCSVQELYSRLHAFPLSMTLHGGTVEQQQQIRVELSHRYSLDQFVLHSTEVPIKSATFDVWLGDSAPTAISWDDLPLVSRLDVSSQGELAAEFLTFVLQSALGVKAEG